MATVNYTDQNAFLDRRIVTWTPLTTTNADGQPLSYEGAENGVVQVFGTFGVGGTILIEGSNDGTHWNTLRETGGSGGSGSAVLSWTAADIAGVLENPVYVRPRVSAGDGTTSLTCIISTRKNQFSG